MRGDGQQLAGGIHANRVNAALLLCLLVACTPPVGRPAVWFIDQAASRGLDFVHTSGFEARYLIPEITGSGVALADLDSDGDLDIYLVQSGSLVSRNDAKDRVFLNRGDGYFTPGPSVPDSDGYGMGVAAGDYDNDGDVDLYVTNVGANLLLRNDGTGRFDNVADQAGVAHTGWGTSAAFLDFDVDGDLDLFVANYIRWRFEAELECTIAGLPTYCPPQNYKAPAPDTLYRNNGDGTFTDVSTKAGMQFVFGNGFGVVGADYNQDGLADIFVANDMMVNQLWLNEGDLRFREAAMDWGCGVDEAGEAKAGMGVAAGDIDDDGDTDVLVVNLKGQTDSLYRNAGGWFTDATGEVGLNAVSRRYTRFGVALADFDNDSRLDLYQANGAVVHLPIDQADPFAEPNTLYQGQAGGRFALVAPEGGTHVELVHTSRGLAVGDVDDDGGLDLVVVNRDAAPYLLMNAVPSRGNWVRFDVRSRHGRHAHATTVSALVLGKRQYRDVQPAASYLSSNDPRVHFGLGSATEIKDVVVTWPGGLRERFGDFPAGQTTSLRQGEGAPVTAHRATNATNARQC